MIACKKNSHQGKTMNLARGCLGAACFFATWLPQNTPEACETTGLSGAAAPGRGLDAEAAAAGLCFCHGVGAMAFKNDQRGERRWSKGHTYGYIWYLFRYLYYIIIHILYTV